MEHAHEVIMDEMFNILQWSVDHMVLSIKWQSYSIGKPAAQEMFNASAQETPQFLTDVRSIFTVVSNWKIWGKFFRQN